MSKSILVFDTPKNCDECRLMHSYFEHGYGWIKECVGSGVNDCIVFGRKLEDYCPLKPMTQKKQIDIYHKLKRWDDDCDMAYSCGYNTCLEDILGGEE